MNQLNNYNLKKGTLILIVVMLLAIPNIHSYSFIGSYQKTSKAITANKKYLFLANDNRKIVFDVVSEVLAPIMPAVVCYVYYDGDGNYYYSLQDYYSNQERQGGSKQHNPIAEQYSKYDFSGFDN